MTIFKKISATIAMFLIFIGAWAQDKKVGVDINVNKGGGDYWYAQPWVWIVGGAIFILLLVALIRSGSSRKD